MPCKVIVHYFAQIQPKMFYWMGPLVFVCGCDGSKRGPKERNYAFKRKSESSFFSKGR